MVDLPALAADVVVRAPIAPAGVLLRVTAQPFTQGGVGVGDGIFFFFSPVGLNFYKVLVSRYLITMSLFSFQDISYFNRISL